jgi:UDP-GlcNAc:undecaprenyl-phosphate GlcNAc-1-phosphate transferase
VAPWAPVIAAAVPLADMAWAVLRRVAAGAPVLAPDKGHIHHQLMAGGLSMRQAVAALWVIAASLGAVAVLVS